MQTCKQCGCYFQLTQQEYNYHNSRGHSLPKRCAPCRRQNKRSKGQLATRRRGPKMTMGYFGGIPFWYVDFDL